MENLSNEKWRSSRRAIFEITTIIPPAGCVVNCMFCPQGVLKNAYKGERSLSLDNFKKILAKIPKEISLSFAGFSEPWLNKECTDMILYAHENDYNITIFTTGVGMSIEDIDKIKHIPFSYRTNVEKYPKGDGGFILHIPDNQNYAKHPITDNYIKLLEHMKEISNSLYNFQVVCMGPVHDKIKHIFPTAEMQFLHSRADNLFKEEKYKPELKKLRRTYAISIYKDYATTCGVPEKLYHTVMLPNGDLTLCCMDWELQHILGNMFEKEYNDIVPELNTSFELCKHCMYGIKNIEL